MVGDSLDISIDLTGMFAAGHIGHPPDGRSSLITEHGVSGARRTCILHAPSDME